MTTRRSIERALVDEVFDNPATITQGDWRYYVPKQTRDRWRQMSRAERFEAMIKADVKKERTLQ